MKHRSRGFTLMELMIVLTLAAIILALGAPSFSEFRRSNRMAGISNDFLVGLQVARSEAIKRQASVSLCPSQNPGDDEAAACTAERDFSGWIVFTDPNNDCQRDDTEELLQVGERVDTGVNPATRTTSAADGTCVSFAATGFTRPEPGSGTLPMRHTVFCDGRGNTKQPGTELSSSRGIELTVTGRARITRDIAEINGFAVECPAPGDDS
jgi:type IV fimbrial biogenesis protein FimT